MRRSNSTHRWILAVGLVVLVAFGFASAQAASGGKTAMAKSRRGAITGQIESVNTDGKVLTIKEKNKTEVQVVWTDTTTLAWNAGKGKTETATVADLKDGEFVSVRAEKTPDGKYAASSIWIRKAMTHPTTGTPNKSTGY